MGLFQYILQAGKSTTLYSDKEELAIARKDTIAGGVSILDLRSGVEYALLSKETFSINQTHDLHIRITNDTASTLGIYGVRSPNQYGS